MSFADHQRQHRRASDDRGLAKSKQPIRDVFAKKQRQQGDSNEDDWISEEEDEAGYAGGLGQLGCKLSAAWGPASAIVDENGSVPNGDSPIVKPTPSPMPPGAPLRKHREKAKDVVNKKKGVEDVTGAGGPSKLGTSPDATWDNTRQLGRGHLKPTRPTRIEEEEEEEEE
jgi:hypothetical protein